MSNISLMALATRKADWLAARQSVLAQNIANANTPAYRARDLASFESAMASARLDMTVTSSKHLAASDEATAPFAMTETSGDSTLNGNTVALEREMSKLGETNSQYALSVNLIKSYHRLTMMSFKG
jgi:flagellar basal-body rod protein FlgB